MSIVKKTPIYKTKEYIKEYNKLYYQKNRANLLEYANKKIFCSVCGVYISKSHFARHCKTKKHIRNMGLKKMA